MVSQYTKKICLVAGKSGGHIIPALTYAQRYIKRSEGEEIVFFSTSGSLDNSIVNQSSLSLHHISLFIDPVPYRYPWRYPLFFYRLLHAFLTSWHWLRVHKPHRIISFGGLVSLPVCLAAYLCRIPFDLYNLDATPGLAVKTLAPLAHKIYVCFIQAQAHLRSYKPVLTSYPVKFSSSDLVQVTTPVYQKLSFDPHKPILLILGGSQGSRAINRAITQALNQHHPALTEVQVIHQVGNNGMHEWRIWYQSRGISAYVFDFISDLSPYYRIANVAVCRAGAGTLFELLYFQIPTIIIPLATTTTAHQIDNARAFSTSHSHLFEYILQEEIEHNPSFLATALARKLLFHPPTTLKKENER